MNKGYNSFFVIICCGFLVNSCTYHEDYFLPEKIYEGYYYTGFEINNFYPCTGDYENETWLITGKDWETYQNFREEYEIVTGKNWGGLVFARLKGVPSKKGKYGIMMANERRFKITGTIELTLADSIGC